ncbi:hypothetical protein SDC9_164275 [bioreactor metagenome]|uniref:Uncharacterized protein n=1 Tax=bioreactor metagenome TaxID=1076179 RepID=A0A645FR77_9ZZZZ
MILGVISPKVSITTVMIKVAAIVPDSPIKPMAITVEIEDAAIFTRLLPISIVDKASSKCSVMYKAIFALDFPAWDAFFNLALFTEAKAISDPEKKAESMIKRTMPI